jgi:TonB family protein
MRFLKVEGTVTVLMVVHTDGTAGHFEVEDSPHPDFTKAALESLREWRFEPGRNEEGLPVATRVRVPVPFRFQE